MSATRSLGMLGLAAAFEGGLLVVALVLGSLLGASPFWTLRLDVPGIVWGIAATGPLLVGLAWSIRVGWQSFEQLTDQVIALLQPWLVHGGVTSFALVSLLAGVAEEALFRGVLQIALVDGLGAAGAIVTAGAFFGLAHAVTPLYAGLAALVGAYLGLAFHLSGNLAVPALAHALYDFVALTWLARLARERVGSASVPGDAQGEQRQARVESTKVVPNDVDVRREGDGLRQSDVVADPESQ